MLVLCVSHSSKDDAHVDALATWLRANGFNDLFIDHQSIAGGDKWPEALRASAGSCRVVVCLVTPHWLASLECFSEFGAAWYMGKRIIPLFLVPLPPNSMKRPKPGSTGYAARIKGSTSHRAKKRGGRSPLMRIRAFEPPEDGITRRRRQLAGWP